MSFEKLFSQKPIFIFPLAPQFAYRYALKSAHVCGFSSSSHMVKLISHLPPTSAYRYASNTGNSCVPKVAIRQFLASICATIAKFFALNPCIIRKPFAKLRSTPTSKYPLCMTDKEPPIFKSAFISKPPTPGTPQYASGISISTSSAAASTDNSVSHSIYAHPYKPGKFTSYVTSTFFNFNSIVPVPPSPRSNFFFNTTTESNKALDSAPYNAIISSTVSNSSFVSSFTYKISVPSSGSTLTTLAPTTPSATTEVNASPPSSIIAVITVTPSATFTLCTTYTVGISFW